jgi:hypothetical protein
MLNSLLRTFFAFTNAYPTVPTFDNGILSAEHSVGIVAGAIAISAILQSGGRMITMSDKVETRFDDDER